jgi:hypothetical protein
LANRGSTNARAIEAALVASSAKVYARFHPQKATEPPRQPNMSRHSGATNEDEHMFHLS